MASTSNLNLLKTITADIEIEVPGDIFESVHVIVNEDHGNRISIHGDKRFFNLKIFGKPQQSSSLV